MKLSFHLKCAFSLLAHGFLALGFSQAAAVPDPVPGDLFLGVRAADGDGASVSYLVKLGPDTLFRSAAPGSGFDVSGLGGVGDDLAATYGAGWFDRPDLSWAIFGARNTANTVVYGSRARLAPAVVTSPWPTLNSTDRNPVATAISSVVDNLGGYKGREATAHSPVATFQPNTSESSSYARQVGTPGTTDFGSTSQWGSVEGHLATGSSDSVLDLYRLAASSGVPNVALVGHFTLARSGVVRFKAPAAAAAVDSDGDGFTDAEEIYAGTNPADGASFWRVATVAPVVNPPGLRIQATAAANRSYVVQYSPDLSSPWIDIFTHSAGPAATALDYTDTHPGRLAVGKGFYRVRIH